jgi:hypothetical protein
MPKNYQCNIINKLLNSVRELFINTINAYSKNKESRLWIIEII